MPHRHLRITLSPSALFAAVILLLSGLTPAMLLGGLAALLHECAHLWAIRREGGRIEAITLHPFGAQIDAPGLRSYRADLHIYAAGVAVNLLTALLCLLFRCFVGETIPPRMDDLIHYFAWSNLTLGLLNLCPVRCLDGGALLECLLLRRYTPERAGQIARRISVSALLVLWLLAVYLMLADPGSVSLFFFCVALFLIS